MLQNIARHTQDEARELRGLFEKQLRELFWTETTVAEMLGGITSTIFSADLSALIKKNIAQASGHIARLEKIFLLIGLPQELLPYKAIECYLDETGEIIDAIKQGVVRDAALIAMLQKIKHYEIACYGTMRAYALALKEEDVVTLLEETLNEEKQADLDLSFIAESHINIEAADKEI